VHANDIKGYVFCSWVLQSVKRDEQSYNAEWLNSFIAQAVERLHWLFQLLLVVAHFFEGRQEKDLDLTAIIDDDSSYIPSIDVDGDDCGVSVWKRS
jgi:hypothetical protein